MVYLLNNLKVIGKYERSLQIYLNNHMKSTEKCLFK